MEQKKEALMRSVEAGKGGFRAALFIYALAGLEQMGFIANMVSLVLYFSNKMYFDLATAANTLTNLMGSTFLLSILPALLSRATYFHTALIFGSLELLGLLMMTIQAHSKNLLPKPCGKATCIEGGVAVYFYASLSLLALGAGGVRGSLLPMGADQFDPKEARRLATFFNWFMFSIMSGGAVGVTFIVWISTTDNTWWKGFLIITVAAFIGFAILAIGKPFYSLHVPAPNTNPIFRIVKVIVVAIKNHGLHYPESPNELYEINNEDSNSTSTKIAHTQQFRWLDRAAIVLPEIKHTINKGPWKVCTVTQVEEVKILIRMMPIVGCTIILNTCLAQLQTFSVQQGYRMDLQIAPGFRVPAASMPLIPMISMLLLLIVYDRLFVPFVRHFFTGHPSGITQLQRIGVGLALASVSMCIAAMVEVRRRRQSLRDPSKPISVLWLGLQYGVFGTADMFSLVGLLEFFYREAPAGMESLATSFAWMSLSLGYFLSSVFVEVINVVTKRVEGGHGGWLHGKDLDKDKLDLFYWFLAILSAVNFLNYLYWATWYKYKN
ncbi:protein NRT1/ PTR FAMILY 4.5-like [Andrographis paniculata]|uniref:protein NRT1/ PTR FAMILY 4.5-like n=1 Tax=Andrographis paniculata TaxID=175694 RepID=UPI0021E6FE70|nr:protein NRT1/ PTR FAMILY 4.5-like [Andrographis paniculata]